MWICGCGLRVIWNEVDEVRILLILHSRKKNAKGSDRVNVSLFDDGNMRQIW